MSTLSDMTTCAACGTGGEGLKKCTACEQVKYCNVACQKEHRPKHKKACKKRAVEIATEKGEAMIAGLDRLSIYGDELFTDPPPREDCPICFLPLPIYPKDYVFQPCCGKRLCNGCIDATDEQNIQENAARALSGTPPLPQNCPFCRAPLLDVSDNNEEIKRIKKRMEANDANAFYYLGMQYRYGRLGLSQDYTKAFELHIKAAELGSATAHYMVGFSYLVGNGVERDAKKGIHHYALSAIGGYEQARHYLGELEKTAGRMDRSVKHFMIAASSGIDNSLDMIREGFMNGHVTKAEYENTLRAHKDAQDEMKSENRTKAASARGW
mmetsp:Transcript_21968/g.47709  ORF Transcript_21968/g.47709 Transcript_21968/m.47709 type:complete len:325 (-) Transcript_21968:423-1397(-)|eukprot:CAMPEP_0172314054 /NCGR_PEP_ID=MMETSP1058-20130122/21555_1 /TAXON_ID=83371 /ORGANISM="Detonula confervacea, Strain CCMP 353" /LENGTH=324 /DNA_ID=CAMNT_0013027811 /DNA_START=63 /DNA_END=1037 /DNA_ORIENTATION=+